MQQGKLGCNGVLVIKATKLSGVAVVESTPFVDHRGSFARFFCAESLHPVLGTRGIVQINSSKTIRSGAIRGMHFQFPPSAEMKLVRCLKGRVWDVAVDLRAGSKTFLQWNAEELSAGDGRMYVIPEGCAHGFQTLDDNTELLYLHTAYYSKPAEGGVHPLDPLLGIEWPLPITEMSDRDRGHSYLQPSFSGIQP